MKYLFTVLLLVTTFCFSQETPVEENKVIIKNFEDNADEVPLIVIENVPVYYGCNQKLSNAKLKQCMSDKIAKHVANNFNTSLGKSLGLPDGIVRIAVIFKIDKEGKIVDIDARAPHPELEKEAIRVVSSLPDMDKPGYQRGEPVIVPYSLPIAFLVDNSSKKKKQKRKGKTKS